MYLGRIPVRGMLADRASRRAGSDCAAHEAPVLPDFRYLVQGGAMPVEPYLFFNGRCEEAIEFYRRALGATDVRIMRNRESPEPPPPGMLPPGSEDKVMHASFRIGGTEVMLSDGRCSGSAKFEGFALSI